MSMVNFGIEDRGYMDDWGNVVTKKQLYEAMHKRFNGNYDKLMEYFLKAIDYSLTARKWVIRDFFRGSEEVQTH